MPGRDIKFVDNGIYHIFNKTTDRSKVFSNENQSFLFLDVLRYYRSFKSTLRYSNYINLAQQLKQSYENQLKIEKYFYVNIFCFSIMPTHYHLLLQQKRNMGISYFISKTINSFTRYYNNKFTRLGQLFLSPFRAVEIRTKEQFIHVSRYIHLNYYSSGLISDVEELFKNPFSSLPRYMNLRKDKLIKKTFLLEMFNNNPLRYKKFIIDNADYQKSLERIKYVEKWK